MDVVRIESVGSTNTWMTSRAEDFSRDTLVYAVEQTAGRGQRGNSWEAEPGMNLTASALLHPRGIEACRQFFISEAVALAVVDLLGLHSIRASVKWPNDVYAGDDRKICGILIEHSLLGREIRHSIAGVGINVNQREFLSDAPNPVSIRQITGEETDIGALALSFAGILESRMARIASPEECALTHREYLAALWCGDGRPHPFADRLRGDRFMASIAAVDPDGILTLADTDGNQRKYAFKEVEFILTE